MRLDPNGDAIILSTHDRLYNDIYRGIGYLTPNISTPMKILSSASKNIGKVLIEKKIFG